MSQFLTLGMARFVVCTVLYVGLHVSHMSLVWTVGQLDSLLLLSVMLYL